MSSVRVYYGHPHIPGDREPLSGGLVKYQRLNQYFPNDPIDYNILYLGSSCLPVNWDEVLYKALKRKAMIVLNQDGVAYPGWPPGLLDPDWKIKINMPMRKILLHSNYIFYQSRFSKLCADKFLRKREKDFEVLYNSVDTKKFTPLSPREDNKTFVMLLGGSQYHFDRVESALKTLSLVVNMGIDCRLLVTGRLCWISDESKAKVMALELARKLEVLERVEWVGFHTQEKAPEIYRRAHILLHLKYNDPCPGLVVEAMACGLPVVYSKSGGVPELAGDDAGIGLDVPHGFSRYCLPDLKKAASAVVKIRSNWDKWSQAARKRAVEKFDLSAWVERHRIVFNRLSGTW